MANQNFFNNTLEQTDPELLGMLRKEYSRQSEHLELIASENYTSQAVLEAIGAKGSLFTNKYAEGYPAKRYYGGCEYADEVENLARQRGQKLYTVGDFVPHVNVQSHSGSQANQAVFLATLKPGDTILSCDLSHGGHLTHGSPVNVSGKWFNAVHYGVDKETELFNFDEILALAKKEKPQMIIAGYSAYPRIVDFKKFRDIADEVGAILLVDMAHISGLVATNYHPSPFPHAHFVTSTTHKTLRGPRGGMIMCHPEDAKKIDSAVFPGMQGGPLVHIIAGKAVMFHEALQNEFKEYCAQVIHNSKVLANELASREYRIVSGGTDNHLMLVDLQSKNVTGKEAELALDVAGINANRNTIPFDTKSPFVTSGMRLGPAALTSRGMGESEMKFIAELIDTAIQAKDDTAKLAAIKQQVKVLCLDFPIYPEI